ncbi:MAG TPA: DEAD/DEAH box helicase [bacterium]|nr:DEAD/DEAH box helicase [bacterium]
MEGIKKLIEGLRLSSSYGKHIHDIITIPPAPAKYAPIPALSPPLRKYLEACGITKLYSHQAEAVTLSLSGKNVITTTPTASGKTLCFNLPVMESLCAAPGTTALYIYPAKALSNDQLNSLQDAFEKSGLNLKAGIYDGDTDASKKRYLRENADIIITNPYELHQVLPFHSKWRRFYKNLRHIVIDEAHRYRGIYGSNIAMLMRRLKRIAALYGASPVLYGSTASISGAAEFMEKLTGSPFTEASENGAPSGEKYLVLWDPSKNPDKSPHTQAKDLLLNTSGNNFQTLLFTGSRKMAELIRIWANKEKKDIPILSYRSGYDPALRREIEARLKNGEIKGLVSTNALELGIDIGMLDVIILSGYPGSISSFWQQAGRAGRKQKESAVFYIPFEDALQKYLMRHPEILTSKKFESAVITTQNPNILLGHILCALSEAPSRDSLVFDGLDTRKEVEYLLERKIITRTPRGIIYSGGARPQDETALDSSGAAKIKIKSGGRLLEEISLNRAYREAHTGAVYIHNGEPYVIQELDIGAGTAAASKEPADYYTEPLKKEDVEILEKYAEKEATGCKLAFGSVSVTEYYQGFKRKRHGSTLSYEALHMPPLKFTTQALWIEPSAAAEPAILSRKLDFEGAIHAAEHALIALAPLFAMCEADDIGGMSYPDYSGDGPVIFIYDGFEGGIGISEKLFEIFPALAEKTLELVLSCGCESGCPACVYSPKCGNNNNPIDKAGAAVFLEKIAE